ncbi:hypothetical protein [Nocardia sp. CC227C]|uniref:hypothetical protein n=1 Tax=Nocardia sp. CC227C TaxID=3044562 RepID=UPI00278C3FE2|nr:hypothetical protein [Nocardia sp. CC227C]
MNLRSLLHRRQAHKGVPLLPNPDDEQARSAPAPRSKPPNEERLERLLTQSELDLVHQHRI